MNKINNIFSEGENIILQDISGSTIYVNSDTGVQKLLEEQGTRINDILEILQKNPNPVNNQIAEKIYNIGYIQNANFSVSCVIQGVEKKIKKFLTSPLTRNSLFWGREDKLNEALLKGL